MILPAILSLAVISLMLLGFWAVANWLAQPKPHFPQEGQALLHAERRSTRCAPVLKTLLFFAITGSKIKLVVLSLTVKTIITAHQVHLPHDRA
jgi:hypothetical protein